LPESSPTPPAAQQLQTTPTPSTTSTLSSATACSKTHGHPGDIGTLDREAPSHTHFGSFTSSPAAGGVIISISNEFASGINTFIENVIAPGWCLALRCSGPGLAVQIINLHLEPAATHEVKVKLFRDIAAAAGSFDGTTFLMGDFNFVPSDETRFQMDECRDASGDTKLALCFETIFPTFTELHQAGYTRKQVTHNLVTTLSRLDRIYTNLQPCLLHDLVVHTHAIGYITNPNNISDHIPVHSKIYPPARTAGPVPAELLDAVAPRVHRDHQGHAGHLHPPGLGHPVACDSPRSTSGHRHGHQGHRRRRGSIHDSAEAILGTHGDEGREGPPAGPRLPCCRRLPQAPRLVHFVSRRRHPPHRAPRPHYRA
jgi:hypothetical protein